MGHAEHIDAATVRFTMHTDGSLDGQINLKSEYTRELEPRGSDGGPAADAPCVRRWGNLLTDWGRPGALRPYSIETP